MSAEVADRQPLDRKSAGIELEARGDVARVEAGDLGAADFHRQRHLARPLQPQAGQRGLAEADHAVEIELGGAKLAVEPRRPIARRPCVGHAALDHAAIDLGAQPLDRDPVGPKRHVALGAPRLELRGRRGLPGEPGHQVLRIVGIDAGAAGKAEPLAERIETPVDLDLRESRRAKFEPVDRPGVAVRAKLAADVLHRRAAERHRIDVERKLAPATTAATRRRASRRTPAPPTSGRRRGASGVASSRSRSTCRADKRALQLRLRAELELAGPGERHRPLVRPVLERHLVQRRRRDTPALTLLVSRHGSNATALPPASTAPAGRDSVSAPSKRGPPARTPAGLRPRRSAGARRSSG